MTASLGASVLVILTFFTALCAMLTLAVHMESTLQRPHRPHRRSSAPAPRHARRVNAPAPGSSSAHSRM
jgi:hypothetical protein